MRALLSTEWAVEGRGGGDEWHWKVRAAEESAKILPHAHTPCSWPCHLRASGWSKRCCNKCYLFNQLVKWQQTCNQLLQYKKRYSWHQSHEDLTSNRQICCHANRMFLVAKLLTAQWRAFVKKNYFHCHEVEIRRLHTLDLKMYDIPITGNKTRRFSRND